MRHKARGTRRGGQGHQHAGQAGGLCCRVEARGPFCSATGTVRDALRRWIWGRGPFRTAAPLGPRVMGCPMGLCGTALAPPPYPPHPPHPPSPGTPVSSGSVLTYGYAAEATAYLMGIGHHAIQGSRLAFVGQFYSRNPQNYNVSIGPERCNMMQFLISPDGVALEKDAKWRHWHCAAMELEAGYYNVTIILEKDLLKSNEDPTLKMGQAVVTPRLLHDVYKMNSQGEVCPALCAPRVPWPGGLG